MSVGREVGKSGGCAFGSLLFVLRLCLFRDLTLTQEPTVNVVEGHDLVVIAYGDNGVIFGDDLKPPGLTLVVGGEQMLLLFVLLINLNDATVSETNKDFSVKVIKRLRVRP